MYEQDLVATGEQNTYFSRDTDGNILYTTHHFEKQELADLLEECGFEEVLIEQKRETSSRRPEESAYFLYATARRPESPTSKVSL